LKGLHLPFVFPPLREGKNSKLINNFKKIRISLENSGKETIFAINY